MPVELKSCDELEIKSKGFDSELRRSDVVLQALSNLYNINSWTTEEGTDGFLSINAEIGKVSADIKLNSCSRVEYLSTSSDSIDSSKILEQCRKMDSPNDLRELIFMVAAVQQCQDRIQKDIAQFKKYCIVRTINKETISITHKNGVIVTITVLDSYPNTPGSVFVENLELREGTIIDSVESSAAAAALQKLMFEANNQCFRTISDIHRFVESRFPEVPNL